MTFPEESTLRALIYGGTEEDRWRLAGDEDLPAWAFRPLLDVGEEVVVASLAMNAQCPPDVLADIAQRSDDVASYARLNPNAWPETKDPSPLGSQSTRSIALYLDARHASRDQRERFAAQHRASPVPGGPSVGEVWARVNS